MLALLLLFSLRNQPHGCTQGSRFEDCEEYLECLADPPSCTELVIEDDPTDPDGGSHNIIGTIPSAIGNLTALVTLVIAESGVSGTIPQTIGLLTMLTYLGLTSAPTIGDPKRLSGTLPQSLGNLTRLENLLVYQTKISGSLPPSLGELTALQTMIMFMNSFTGEIPETLFQLTNLSLFDLNDNLISGTLSESVGELTALTHLDVYDNYLSGTLTATIGELTALTVLDVGFNVLSGTLAETIGELTALTQLDVSYNQISGTVPDILAALTSLTSLYLEDNSFIALGGSICAIQDHLTMGCDLSNNKIPGDFNAQGGKTNCPVCLNGDGNCNKYNQGSSSDQPIFPNKVCNFTQSQCACWFSSPTQAPSPTTAPTEAPTMSSHATHRWKQYDTTLLVVMLALFIGAVFILTFVVVYETIIISRNACRDSKLRGTPYTGALGHAFYNRFCWCYTKRGREEHAYRTAADDIVMFQTSSTLEAPFLVDAGVRGGVEGGGIQTPM